MSVNFYPLLPVPLKERRQLKKFLAVMAMNEGRQLEQLDFIFCTDKYLLDINNKYLKHNFYTDIITFDLGVAASNIVYGEIYISAERVKENAKLFKSTYAQELHRVIFHGVLHLCGYGDKSSREKKTMTDKEDFYLQHYQQFHVEQLSL